MGATVGVIVPCRNEAAVIARKLRNLAACAWPASERPHRIVVVDDGSTDATAELARAELARFDARSVYVDVLANTIRPGKSGAIEAGLHALGDAIDLVVLTDADVVIEPQALCELASAFEREPRLGMATGSQTFVKSLADDGSVRAANGGPWMSANTPYDRATAWARALESRCGLVFSVHGQLLAWRRVLALAPTAGIAADDLDLMLQARMQRSRVEQVRAARFFECRPSNAAERELQSQRRARAYVQFLAHPRIGELTRGGTWLARLHAWAYLHANALSTLASGAIVAVVLVALSFGAGWAILAFVAGVIAQRALWGGGSPLGWIELAKLRESRSTMQDRWETSRS